MAVKIPVLVTIAALAILVLGAFAWCLPRHGSGPNLP